jgi:hypothetical protein
MCKVGDIRKASANLEDTLPVFQSVGLLLRRCIPGQAPVLTPVILATQDVEIRRINVRSQPVLETIS